MVHLLNRSLLTSFREISSVCGHSVWTHCRLSELYLKGKPARGPLGRQKQLLRKHIIQYLSHQLLDASSWQEHSPSSRVWGSVHQLEAGDAGGGTSAKRASKQRSSVSSHRMYLKFNHMLSFNQSSIPRSNARVG